MHKSLLAVGSVVGVVCLAIGIAVFSPSVASTSDGSGSSNPDIPRGADGKIDYNEQPRSGPDVDFSAELGPSFPELDLKPQWISPDAMKARAGEAAQLGQDADKRPSRVPMPVAHELVGPDLAPSAEGRAVTFYVVGQSTDCWQPASLEISSNSAGELVVLATERPGPTAAGLCHGSLQLYRVLTSVPADVNMQRLVVRSALPT